MLALLQAVQPTLAQQLIDAAAPLLASLLVLVLTYVGNAAKKWLDGKVELDNFNKVAHLAEAAVLALEQTMVTELRSLAADGRLSADDLAQVKLRAIAEVKLALSKQGIDKLMKALGYTSDHEIDSLISLQIEAAVARAKSTLGRKIEATIEDKTETGVDGGKVAAAAVPTADQLRREGSGS